MVGLTQDVVKILGLTTPDERLAPLQFVEKVERGLPLRSLDLLVWQIAPEDKKFSYRIIYRATLNRRRAAKEKRLSTDESEKVARLARIWSGAMRVWGNEK